MVSVPERYGPGGGVERVREEGGEVDEGEQRGLGDGVRREKSPQSVFVPGLEKIRREFFF